MIKIKIRKRIAETVKGYIVCGNAYTILFDFDEEWNAYEDKTARFIYNGEHVDVDFKGNECRAPKLFNVDMVEVGVFAGDIATTSSSIVRCVKSIKCGNSKEAAATYVDTPLTITGNGTVETPKNTRYNPIIIDVTMPTLNAPIIEFNANGGLLYVLDGKNGNFTKEYELYLNGEKNTTFTAKSLLMQDYGISETDEIGIVAVGDLFNNSPMATARWSDLELGTIGLTYSGSAWTGIGTATDTNIVVAGLVNNVAITTVKAGNSPNVRKITFPNSLITVGNALRMPKNSTFIFGTGIKSLDANAFYYATNCVFDFSKAEGVVAIGIYTFGNPSNQNDAPQNCTYIVPDEDYNDYLVATNWVSRASGIVKKSIWDAQQGGTV